MQTIKSNDLTKLVGQSDIDSMTFIKKFLVTIGIGADGKTYYIARDGKVFDPSKMPSARKTRKRIGGGPIKTSASIPVSMAKFAAADKYIEVEADLGFELTCIVLNQQTNEFMGSCPKEQYP